MAELIDAGKARSPALSRPAILRAVESLVDRKQIVRTGAGKKGDPYLYHPPSAVSSQRQTYRRNEWVGRNERVRGDGDDLRERTGLTWSVLL